MSLFNILSDLQKLHDASHDLPTLPSSANYSHHDSTAAQELIALPETGEGAQFVWPQDTLCKELVHARLNMLELLWHKSTDPNVQRASWLEAELLRKFEKEGNLAVYEDICLFVEEAYGIGPVAPEGTTDQAVIAQCYDLIDSICEHLMDDLGYTTRMPHEHLLHSIRQAPQL